MLHRAGRVTASIAKQVYCMTEKNKSLLKIIMQYDDHIDDKFTRYEINTELQARNFL